MPSASFQSDKRPMIRASQRPSPSIVGLSDVVVDVYLRVNRLPGLGEKVQATFMGRMAGGTVPNAMCAASRLGARTYFVGRAGDDDHGALATDDLRRFGVDTSHVRTVPGSATAWTVVVLTPSGERVIYLVSDACSPDGDTPECRDAGSRWPQGITAIEEEDLTLIRESDALYLSPHIGREALSQALAAAKAGGTLVAVDLERAALEYLESPWQIMASCDMVFLNDEACSWLAGCAGVPPDEVLARVARLGPSFVVNTKGPRGALVLAGGQEIMSPGFKVPVADTTGAGDCFNAAFLCAVLWGWDAGTALRFANAAGALAVTAVGPRGNLPTLQQVLEFMRGRNCAEVPGECSAG